MVTTKWVADVGSSSKAMGFMELWCSGIESGCTNINPVGDPAENLLHFEGVRDLFRPEATGRCLLSKRNVTGSIMRSAIDKAALLQHFYNFTKGDKRECLDTSCTVVGESILTLAQIAVSGLDQQRTHTTDRVCHIKAGCEVEENVVDSNLVQIGTQKEAAGTDAQTHEQTKLIQVAHKAMKVRQLRFKLGKKLHKKEKNFVNVVVATSVREEEIPDGAVTMITPNMASVFIHVSDRARYLANVPFTSPHTTVV
ncbi:hypothetical protein Tco_0517623 [Tanacetum coccineum]